MRVDSPRGEIVDMRPQGEPCYYVRGHVDLETARAAIYRWHDYEDDGDLPDIGPGRHAWGRWRHVREDDYGLDDGCTHVWETRGTPAPGWARVTEVWRTSEWRNREEARAVEYEARARVRRRWPGVRVLRVSPFPWRRREDVTVVFDVGGIEATWHPWRSLATIRAVRRSEYTSVVALRSRWADVDGKRL